LGQPGALRRNTVVVLILVLTAVILPDGLPAVPISDVHSLPAIAPGVLLAWCQALPYGVRYNLTRS
jgi:hypothetical protein